MPGTNQEYLDYAVGTGVAPIRWEDGTAVTVRERDDLAALRAYHRQRITRLEPGPQRKAMRLLRSFLSPEQLRQLRTGKAFLVIAPSGQEYRLWPKTGSVDRVTIHGRRRFAASRFCLHDDPGPDGGRMPPADLSLAHMLWLLADEPGFLATANATNARDQLWCGDYLRRMRNRTGVYTQVPEGGGAC